MILTDNWFTALAENEDGTYTFISGRSGIDEFIASGKFKERIEITWRFITPDEKGLPTDDHEAELMEEVEERLRLAVEKNKLAILTGVYTGQGTRQWIYVTRNTAAFGELLNKTLQIYPEKLPIEIFAAKDPNNQEYKELLELKQEED